MCQSYVLHLPVKPHIKKYVETLQGAPLNLRSEDPLSLIIRAIIRTRSRTRLSAAQKGIHFSRRKAQLEIVIPHYRKVPRYHMTADCAILINRILEDSFERTFLAFVTSFVADGRRCRGQLYLEAFQAFAAMYNIELEEDISLDSFKKMEYRAREKKVEKKCATFVPFATSPYTMRVSAAAVA